MNIRIFSIFAIAVALLSSCALDEIMTESGFIHAEMENEQTRTAVALTSFQKYLYLNNLP